MDENKVIDMRPQRLSISDIPFLPIDRNGEEIGRAEFDPSDSECLAAYTRLTGMYIEAAEKRHGIFKEYDGKSEADNENLNPDNVLAQLDNLSRGFDVEAQAFDNMSPLVDLAFGEGVKEIIFGKSKNMYRMFALIDWASEHVDPETNQEWQDHKARIERLKDAKLNREQRRAQRKN